MRHIADLEGQDGAEGFADAGKSHEPLDGRSASDFGANAFLRASIRFSDLRASSCTTIMLAVTGGSLARQVLRYSRPRRPKRSLKLCECRL